MLKNFVLLFILFGSFIPDAKLFELVYDERPGSGWTSKNEFDGAEYTFTCPPGFAEKHKDLLTFRMGGIPNHTKLKSLTIQDCDLVLIITPQFRNLELDELTIRNISRLIVMRSYLYRLVRLKEHVPVLTLDNIRLIKNIETNELAGDYKEIHIRKCFIENLEWNSFNIMKIELFEFTDNTVVNSSSQPFNFVEAENVIFSGNEFQSLGNYFIHFSREAHRSNLNFQFRFNKIHQSKLHTLDFQLYDFQNSIQDNEFECLKSEWLVQRKNQICSTVNTDSTISRDQKFIIEEYSNVCSDTELQGTPIKTFIETCPNGESHFPAWSEETYGDLTSSENDNYDQNIQIVQSTASANVKIFFSHLFLGTFLLLLLS